MFDKDTERYTEVQVQPITIQKLDVDEASSTIAGYPDMLTIQNNSGKCSGLASSAPDLKHYIKYIFSSSFSRNAYVFFESYFCHFIHTCPRNQVDSQLNYSYQYFV